MNWRMSYFGTGRELYGKISPTFPEKHTDPIYNAEEKARQGSRLLIFWLTFYNEDRDNPKRRWNFIGLHGATSQKLTLFIVNAMINYIFLFSVFAKNRFRLLQTSWQLFDSIFGTVETDKLKCPINVGTALDRFYLTILILQHSCLSVLFCVCIAVQCLCVENALPVLSSNDIYMSPIITLLSNIN